MSSLLGPLIWSFLPSTLAHSLLPHLSTRLPALFPPAPRGSPAYARNHRHALTLLVVGWLACAAAFATDSDAEDDWYALLGVGWRATDDELRRAWRGLSRAHHPDRAGADGEARFIALRDAYEALADPVRRYAYDRFGPGIADIKAASVREYVVAGLVRSLGFYIVSAGIMLVLTVVGKARNGAYWRHTLFALLAVLELGLLVSPTPAAAPSWRLAGQHLPVRFPPDRPPFLLVRSLHRLWANVSIGITQLAGVWADAGAGGGIGAGVGTDAHVLALAAQVQAEAVGALHNEVAAVVGDSPALESALRSQVEHVFVDRALYSHPVVLPAFRAASQRAAARAQAPTQLAMAASIPLPPSPPPSPRIGPIGLS
ncbi:hypothetical protein Q5752_000162 [Cryptotrichosporon argae]